LPLDIPLLQSTVNTAMRMLDNAIDISAFPGEAAGVTARQHRPAALGILGFQDALDRAKVSYASPKAAELADRSMEIIAHRAILASAALAGERGAYPGYAGSKWSHGLLPMDTLALLAAERGGALDIDLSMTQDWEKVRDAVRRQGLRHCTVTAISPTDAGAKITGVSPSIEPAGSRPKDGPGTATVTGPQWMIECAARRQKWLDMGQTLTLYGVDRDPVALAEVCLQAWEKGLKTMRQVHSVARPPKLKAPAEGGKRREAASPPRRARLDPISVKYSF
jgi:ribonucleoside-diphosphate reductase alpha chain